jgi:hypothetical protein
MSFYVWILVHELNVFILCVICVCVGCSVDLGARSTFYISQSLLGKVYGYDGSSATCRASMSGHPAAAT